MQPECVPVAQNDQNYYPSRSRESAIAIRFCSGMIAVFVAILSDGLNIVDESVSLSSVVNSSLPCVTIRIDTFPYSAV